MKLAIFDLDNTLLKGDSDYLWGQYLVEQGLVEGAQYERENRRYYAEYKAGTLDVFEFLRFSLQPLGQYPLKQLQTLRDRFVQDKIMPLLLPKAYDLLACHRSKGDTLLIITATNRFVTEPIALALGIDPDHLVATDPEMVNGRYTGQISGTPCFREGKIRCLKEWLQKRNLLLESSCFYSDSHNDLPLLEWVTHPIAVNPDDTLHQHAAMRGWPIINLR